MRDLINLTDEQIEDETEACVEDLVFTQDSLDTFDEASKSYNEHGRKERGMTEGGHPYLLIAKAQVRKGDQRRDVLVVDFGTVRTVS